MLQLREKCGGGECGVCVGGGGKGRGETQSMVNSSSVRNVMKWSEPCT